MTQNYTRKRFIWTVAATAIAALALGLIIGRLLPSTPEVSFYAHVVEQSEHRLLVEGIAENDINHRSTFAVSLPDKVKLDANIVTGSLVKIVYNGVAMESFPLQIHALKVQLAE